MQLGMILLHYHHLYLVKDLGIQSSRFDKQSSVFIIRVPMAATIVFVQGVHLPVHCRQFQKRRRLLDDCQIFLLVDVNDDMVQTVGPDGMRFGKDPS